MINITKIIAIFFICLIFGCSDKSNKSILNAVSENNIEKLNKLITDGGNINILDSNGCSPLLIAIKNKNNEIAKILINKNADINLKDKKNNTALDFALLTNNSEIAKILINKEILINDYLKTLNETTSTCNLEIFKMLLDKRKDDTIFNYKSIYKTAIENDCDLIFSEINKKDINDIDTLLNYSIEKSSFKIVKYLIDKGANVNLVYKNGTTPLLIASKKSNINILKLLIEKGSKINIKDNTGATPLMIAILNGRFENEKYLLARGAEVNEKDKSGYSSLAWATTYNDFNSMTLLISKGADINAKNKEGRNILLLALNAVPEANTVVLEYLLKKGADMFAKDNEGNYAKQVAFNSSKDKIIQLFRKKY